MHDCGREKLCAVVVTYHPLGDIGMRLERAARQVAHLVVVDNASGAEIVAQLEAMAARSTLQLVRNFENRGIATALNQGVAVAKQRGFRRVLLLDQDSVVQDDLISILCGALGDHPAPEQVAVVGANYVETGNGRPLIESDGSASWVERRTAITSGSLVAVAAFDAVGGFRDELFIDEVDTDFCFRVRRHGFRVIVTTRLAMSHTIGDGHRERRFLWRTVRPVNYSVTRWYYIARNTVVLAREQWRREPDWVRANVTGHLKWLAKALLYEPDRGQKLRSVLRGVVHGISGRLGPRS